MLSDITEYIMTVFCGYQKQLYECYGKPKGTIIYYETQYFHGQNAWVKSFVHGQNHFSMGKFFLSMGEFICAWAKSF